jgi:hypothetical protein
VSADATKSSTLRFALLCVAVILGVGAYIAYSLSRTAEPSAPPATPVDPARLTELRHQSHLLFRITSLGADYGRVGAVSVSAPSEAPVVTELTCDRVHASAEYGLCLQADRGVLTTYRALAFGADLRSHFEFPLQGAPSRTRTSAKAPLAASTVFVSGDSYSSGSFSTRTTLYDLRSNRIVGDLETFAVMRDGKAFKNQDFNFWGVTFKDDGDGFYATLGTSGTRLLVQGSIRDRKMTVIGSDVECPMLSPDGTRLVFKNRVLESGRLSWRLRVLDLGSGALIDLAETRNVDDQAEWLDDRRVLYALPRLGTASSDVWVVPADGSGAPEVLVREAFSPAVVRVTP